MDADWTWGWFHDALLQAGGPPAEVLGLVGALLLTAATLPQAVRLLRTRRAEDFHGAFVAISLSGCALLAVHALRLGDAVFLAVNGVGVAFWSLAAWTRFVRPQRAPAIGGATPQAEPDDRPPAPASASPEPPAAPSSDVQCGHRVALRSISLKQ